MAEIFDFGLQKYNLRLKGSYQNNLFAVVGDTARRLEIQLIDASGAIVNTPGLSVRLSTIVGEDVTYADAVAVDVATGLYQVDLAAGMLLKPGIQEFQWTITDANGATINSFVFKGTIGKNITFGGAPSYNFYLKYDELQSKIDELNANNAQMLADFNTAVGAITVDSEVVLARDGHATLGGRLDDNDITRVSSINIKHPMFAGGAVGDGETDDSDAIQAAVDYAYSSGINSVYAPAGTYYLSKAIHTRNDTDWTLKGIEFFGAGMSTVFQRVRNSERITTPRSWFQANSDNATKAEESCFAVHSMRNIFRNFTVTWTKVGIYLGQDNRSPLARNWVNFNRFDNIFVQYIGTGIVFRPGISCYYNTFRAIQIAEGNIGIDMAEEYTPDPTFMTVSNRNSFTQCEINKVWLGVLLLNGDTNTFDNVHFENLEDLGADGTWGPQPPQLVGGVRTALHIGYALNNVTNCTIEFCDRDAYDDGYGNNYINNNINLIDGKFLRGPNSRIGSFIGAGQDGVSNAFNKGGLLFQHENKITDLGALDAKYPKWSTIATEPFLLAKDMYDIEDMGTSYKHYDGKEYGIEANMTPTPVSINSVDSVFYHKKIGGINQVILRAYVQMAAGDINTPIVITLPKAPSAKLSSYAFNQPMGFPALVANAFAIARFNLDGELVVIPPAGGWSTTTERTAIEVQITYF